MTMNVHEGYVVILPYSTPKYIALDWTQEYGDIYSWTTNKQGAHTFTNKLEAKEVIQRHFADSLEHYEIRSYKSCFFFQIGERNLRKEELESNE